MSLIIKFGLNYSYSGISLVALILLLGVSISGQNRVSSIAFSISDTKFATSLQQYASFQDSCRDIRINGNTLSARCLNERGNYATTSIEVRGITNVNGVLEYLRDGRGRSTYQDSCRDIRINGANLSAQCQREDNSYNYSSIILRDIVNNDGRLQYSRGNGGNIPNPPSDNSASFQESCRNIRVAQTTLSAQCRGENGRWRDSSIEIRGITNMNGNLEYLRDGRGRSTYQNSCSNIRINGARLQARCQRENGSYRQSSINLIGIVNDNGRLRYRL